MWRRISFVLSVAFLVANSRGQNLEQTREKLAAHVSHSKFASAIWGVKVVSLETGATLFETNAEKLLKPASNGKLFTGALALDKFGPNYKIKTSFLAKQRPGADGVLKGDLTVYGRGDFSISARFNKGSYNDLFAEAIETLKAAGIKTVDGDLVGDETYFRGPRYGSGWTWDDLNYYYGAEVSALTFQDNVVDLYFRPGKTPGEPCSFTLKPQTDYLEFINKTVTGESNTTAGINIYRPLIEQRVFVTGKLPLNYGTFSEAATVPNPALWYVQMLKAEMERAGIRVAGKTRTKEWLRDAPTDPREFVEVASFESRPMGEMVEKMMKPSQNLYAQLLLLQAGANSENAARYSTTEDAGIAELKRFLSKANVRSAEIQLEDGSGLSRASLVTPNAIVQLLRHMVRHQHARAYFDSLPEAGVDGTLRNRLKELKGNLHAKTGTLRFVNTLSGYMKTGAGEPVAFSIMLNGFAGAGNGRAEIDYIPIALATLSEKSAKADK